MKATGSLKGQPSHLNHKTKRRDSMSQMDVASIHGIRDASKLADAGSAHTKRRTAITHHRASTIVADVAGGEGGLR